MGPDTIAATKEKPEVLCRWSARKMQPIILIYVAAVFVAMILVSYFVLHSTTGVKALAITAFGSIVTLLPGAFSRVEYRLAGRGLERRPVDENERKEFSDVFRFDELSHIVPIAHGFKFYRPLNESNALRRFWKAHVSDEFSGEVHVEKKDQERVLGVLAQHGVQRR